MEIANKHHMPNDSTMTLIQASSFYEHNFVPTPSPDLYRITEHPKIVYQDSESPKKACGSNESSPSSINSSVLGYQHEGNSVIRFNPEYGHFVHVNGSLLSFDQAIKPVRRNLFPVSSEEEYQFWDEDLHPNSTTTNQGLPDTSADVFAPPNGGAHIPWASSDRDGSVIDHCGDQDQLGRDGSSNKRLTMGENVQVMKKQCLASPSKKQPKSKSASPISKDPQSMAAKNRRERISERLKILQDLVPNGSKVDLVTMLEKAIGYVKFLQLQVKVLATDEFWPAQGGKAPDLTQVKEAIDAILASSQRDRSSSSK